MSNNWFLNDYKGIIKQRGRIIPVVMQELLTAEMAQKEKRDYLHLHPSDISKKHFCPRASWYKINGQEAAPDRHTMSRLNVFEEGNNIHRKWQGWLKQAGILWGLWKCQECENVWYDKSPKQCPSCGSSLFVYREVPLRDDEHRIIGHADGEIEDDQGRALIEIKSVGLGTVRWENPTLFEAYEKKEITLDEMWDNIKRPFASHLRQGNLYMHCRKLNTMIFIYEWKPSQQVKEFETKFQPEVIAPVLEKCKQVIDHLESGTEPVRPEWATTKSCAGCRYCPFKEVCWLGEKAD